ncbi:hypothetical protein Cantr_03103 [Candida viswanathii]|uniref:Uncharacterized protein n=1 Tax=Candida viswanathii TaxID=5486 RepID=A0A367YPP0_9ASCO|nr:hypothetical protein Cantr_03103 [Candida viswanathii]
MGGGTDLQSATSTPEPISVHDEIQQLTNRIIALEKSVQRGEEREALESKNFRLKWDTIWWISVLFAAMCCFITMFLGEIQRQAVYYDYKKTRGCD